MGSPQRFTSRSDKLMEHNLVAGKAFAAAALLIAATPAAASQWWYVGYSGQAPTRVFDYIESSSIRGIGRFRTAWVETVYEQPADKTQRTLFLFSFDCSQRRRSIIKFVVYDLQGRVVRSGKPLPEWEVNGAGTMAEVFTRFACEGPGKNDTVVNGKTAAEIQNEGARR